MRPNFELLCWHLGVDADRTDHRDEGRASHRTGHVHVGDGASFEERHLQTRTGITVRINQRTATLDCDGQSWRVSIALLRHIVDLWAIRLTGITGPIRTNALNLQFLPDRLVNDDFRKCGC